MQYSEKENDRMSDPMDDSGTCCSDDNSVKKYSLAQSMQEFGSRIRPLTSITLEISEKAVEMLLEGNRKYLPNSISRIGDNPLLAGLIKREVIGKMFSTSSDTNDDSIFLTSKIHSRSASENPFVTKLKVKDTVPKIMLTQDTSYRTTWFVLPSTRITIVDEVTDKSSDSKSFPTTFCKDSIQKETFNNATNILKHTFFAMSKASLINKVRGRTKQNKDEIEMPTMKFNIPRAFVLTGPPGVGKTYSIRQVVEFFNSHELRNICKISLKNLRGSELFGFGYGETEAELRKMFNELADECSKLNTFGLIFIDEGEALLQSQGATSQLGSLLDIVSSSSLSVTCNGWENIVVVVATNHLESIPSILRRPGRFDREIHVRPPDKDQRFNILKSILYHDGNFFQEEISDKDLKKLAEDCVGYVAADLNALVRKAFFSTIHDGRSLVNLHGLTIDALRAAMSQVGASALRDAVLSAPPSTRWDDIGGDAGGAKEALRRAIEWPRVKRNSFACLGLSPPRGILLHGPPGCAKTTLARAAAGASGVAFFVLSPADVYSSSYVGEAESVIRRAFRIARSASPCILFIDEIDAILGSTDGNGIQGRGSSSNAEARVLSTFLNEMDGVDTSVKDGVLVLGATNRPSILDTALLRPGRFDKVIYVPPPDYDGRLSILSLHCSKWNNEGGDYDEIDDQIDLNILASDEISGRMTGAEIEGACQEAVTVAFKECLAKGDNTCHVLHRHLLHALKQVKPLLSDDKILHEYESFEESRKM